MTLCLRQMGLFSPFHNHYPPMIQGFQSPTSNDPYCVTMGSTKFISQWVCFLSFSPSGPIVNNNLAHCSWFEPKAKKKVQGRRPAKAISRLAAHATRRQTNVLDVIVMADCLQSRGIPRSLIHMNKQPDYHRVECAPVKKFSLVSATTYPSFIVFGNKKCLKPV